MPKSQLIVSPTVLFLCFADSCGLADTAVPDTTRCTVQLPPVSICFLHQVPECLLRYLLSSISGKPYLVVSEVSL